jgi:hypothetical protein
MQAPGTVGGVVRVPCRSPGTVVRGVFGPIRVSGTVVRPAWACAVHLAWWSRAGWAPCRYLARWPGCSAGMRSGGTLSSVGWGGGAAPIGSAGQLPAALLDLPVVGSTQQGEVGQVGRAPMQPVPQVVGFAPGQRPVTGREPTAAVADGKGGALGGLDDSGGPAHLQRLTRCPTQHRGQQDGRGPQPRFQSGCPVPVTGRHGLVVTLAGFGRAVVWVGLGGGLAADHHPGHGPITGQAPTRLRGQWPCPAHLATHPARTAKQAVQLHRHQQLGPDPTRLG